MNREPWANALTATLALSVCHATAGGLAFESEMEDTFLKWFSRPGMQLSVFNNAGDLEACGERVGANASYVISRPPLAFDDSATDGFHVDASMDNLRAFLEFSDEHGFQVDVSLGEHNNPFFMYYPPEFVERHPDSFMRDREGNLIQVTSNPIHDAHSLVPAVCDPVLQRMVSRYLRGGIPVIARHDAIHAWIIKGEESWPDYFGLPMGDFREQSIEQFRAWLGEQRPGVVLDPMELAPDEEGPVSTAWYMYREQAMTDRAAWYLRDHLASDPKGRPVLYATHGNPFSDRHRRGLGLAPGLLAGACDGFEMGHIAIDDDTESLNLLYMNVLGAYGLPVTVPRLGNKTLDLEARGGGRTFTPRMLRRMVYECLGMGVPHIGPITWDVSLGDGEWFIKDTPAEAACREVFAEIREAGPFLEGMARV
jgi:hypothetical protein